MEFIKIKETCLYIHDLERAKRFYHEQLGLQVIGYFPEKHLFLRAGSSVLLCFNPEDSRTKKNPPAHYGGAKQHFAFEVAKEHYQSARNEVLAKGIKIIDDVRWTEGVESFYFEDPEGNILEIVPNSGIWD